MAHAQTGIADKVVVVTGGAAGLGRAVVNRVLLAGGRPVALDMRPVDDVASVQVDLADGRAAEDAINTVAVREGRIDAVVAAAGTDACGNMADVLPEDWERVIRVNLMGVAAVARAALPHLRGQRGRLVTVASTLGLRALPAATAYCASKFGVLGLSRALAVELQGEIGVTTILPGGMDTSFFDGRPEQFRPADDALLADPDDVADAILYALGRPSGLEVREMVICPSVEPSWP